MLKVLSCAAIGSLWLAPAALAEGAGAETCRRGADVRVIEVLAPGTVGSACDVRVTRDGGARVNTPYHANVDRNFCRAMAAELASQLTLDGFECSASASSAVEAALAGGEAPAASAAPTLSDLPLDQQAEQLKLAGSPAAEPEIEAAPENLPAAAPAPLTMAPIADAAPEARPAPAPAPEPVKSVAATPSLDGIVDLEEPSAPLVLTAGAQPAGERAPRPVGRGAGRIVGAQPSLEDIIDVSVNPAAAPQAAAAGALAPRSTEAIIKSVMAANAAAWNEGNLSAFLGGYLNSADVRLVADGVIATGAKSVRKHYEALVAGLGAMGRLSFTDLDVSMTAPDVATVVGRYAHESGPAKSTGAMTVVLKQIDGRWRIVQDTRVKDPAVPTLAPVN